VSTYASSEIPEAGTIDMPLEVVTLPVSDVDRAKRLYQSLGWRTDADIVVGDAFRAVQLATPTQSDRRSRGWCSLTDESGSRGSNRSTHWARQAGGSQGSPK
jgi:catechol 2,3-dioxygenase-like lactoylglutathione lyase family enzyme